MKRNHWYQHLRIVSHLTLAIAVANFAMLSFPVWADDEQHSIATTKHSPPTSDEAKARARILFESITGSLLVMHRDFFDDEDGFAIPSRSLDDVFLELKKSHNIQLKWLTVNADSMNVDHDPKTEFEKEAATALASGKDFFEATTAENYQFAGAIGLESQCLKCHVQRRTDNQPRTSGLTISIPVEIAQAR